MIQLYIKTHNITGLKYFGKTTKDPYKYLGSGKYWRAHLQKHGKDISTEVLGSFDDVQEASVVALRFSKEQNIVRSALWANMIVENALDGQPPGNKRGPISEAHRVKISATSKKRWTDPAYKERLQQSHKEAWSEERRLKHQNWLAIHWTDDRKKHQRETLRGRKSPLAGLPGKKKAEGHGARVSAALTGVPKIRCCRLHDRREMSVGEFTKWVNRVPSSNIHSKLP
jgi:hypothetical protein